MKAMIRKPSRFGRKTWKVIEKALSAGVRAVF
jgi:hypothetical protein